MMRREPDNLYDDFTDLFDNFAEDKPESLSQNESSESLEDLIDLFEENFPEEENAYERISLSSLPSEEQIRDIFSDDSGWETNQNWSTPANPYEDTEIQVRRSHPQKPTVVNHSFDEELRDLFKDDLEDTKAIFPETLRSRQEPLSVVEEAQDIEEENPWDELEELLSEQTRGKPAPTPVVSPQIKPSEKLLEKDLIISFYDSYEELENLIETPAHILTEDPKATNIFSELEDLIDTPAPSITTDPPIEVTPETLIEKPEPEPVNDEFEDLVKLLEQTNQSMGGTPGVPTVSGQRATARKPSKTVEQTMRVPIKQLDNLSNLIGELVVKRNRLEQDQERLRLFLDNLLNQVQQLSDVGGRMQDLYERTLLEGALLASRNRGRAEGAGGAETPQEVQESDAQPQNPVAQDLDALEMDRFTDFHLLSQEMIELIVRVRESASDIQFIVDETDQVARNLRQVTTQLQEGMTKSRMIAFAQTADRLPRAVLEISRKIDKQAKLNIEGRDVLIDKMILEHLYNPMTHLVNNAITHGIESPEERVKKGKPPEGRIMVRAFLQGNQTVISVADDGAGIDAEKVKRKAVEKGLITKQEATSLSPQDVYDLLFHAGFSTKDKADDFSGRGVGLDVVRKEMSEIRGSIMIDSTLGKGTTFTIRLPLTLSISKALCCISNYARIAFPMDGVEDMKDFDAHEVKTNSEGQKCIPWRDSLLPYQPLSDLLSYNRQITRGNVYGAKQEEDNIAIVILRSTGNLLAVQVDQVLGEQEIVIKQIEGPMPKPPGIAGATVLGDGTVMPIGDVLELIEIAQGRVRSDGINSPWRRSTLMTPIEGGTQIEPTVLIVDDSIVVRELLSLRFNQAGYRVEQARDGQEAWEKLRSGLPCDIVFCDIEMPRMNGLELLSNVQKDERLSDVPIAFLTSRGADRHQKVAAKLGASGYFIKPCPDKDLLDAAKRIIAGEVLLAGSTKVPRKPKLESNVIAFIPRPEPIPEIHSYPPVQPPKNPPRSTNLVLIIDDSVMVREMLSMTFNKAGYEIEQARDGQEAWEKLQSGLTCDLILCDIEMPRMNGLELLSRLQEDEKFSSIPVAMITSRGAQKMQNIAAERGAKGYFVKPYIEEVLLDAAKRLIAGEVLLDKNTKVES